MSRPSLLIESMIMDENIIEDELNYIFCELIAVNVWYCFLLLKFLLGAFKQYVHVALAAPIYTNCVSIPALGLFLTIFFDHPV